MGQSLDNLTALSIPKYKLDKFTMDRYNSIVKFKTSYYSFHLPIALAMFMVCNTLFNIEVNFSIYFFSAFSCMSYKIFDMSLLIYISKLITILYQTTSV